MINPYAEWLGLPPEVTEPNFFELLQIDPDQSDAGSAAIAADRALTKVRGCRPGEYALQWAELLDEIRQAKQALSDPQEFEKRRHDLKSAFMLPPSKSAATPTDRAGAKAAPGQETPKTQNHVDRVSSQPPAAAKAEKPGSATMPGTGKPGDAPQQPSAPVEPAVPEPAEVPIPATPAEAVVAADPMAPFQPSGPASPIGSENAPMVAETVPAETAASEPAPELAAPDEPFSAQPPQPALTLEMPTDVGAPADTAMPAAPVLKAASHSEADEVSETSPPAAAPGFPVVPPAASLDSSAPLDSLAPLDVASPNMPAEIDPMAPVALPAAPIGVPQASDGVSAEHPTPIAGAAVTNHADADQEHVKRQVSDDLVVVAERDSGRSSGLLRNLVILAICFGLFAIGGYFVVDMSGILERGDGSTTAQNDSGNGNAGDSTGTGQGSNGQGSNGQNTAGQGNSGGQGTSTGMTGGETNSGGDEQNPSSNGGNTNGQSTDDGDGPDSGGPDSETGNGDSDDNNGEDNDPDGNGTGIDDVNPDEVNPDGGDPNGGDSTDDSSDPTPADVIAFGEKLEAANQALFARDLDGAKALLEEARLIQVRPMDSAMADRLDLMAEHLETFWKAVHDGCQLLDSGMELKVNDTTFVSIVEVQPELLIYRFAGETYRKPPIELPPALARIIAEKALPTAGGLNRIVKGASFAIERVTDPSRRDRAISMWEEAALMGANTDELMAYLDDDYDLAVTLVEQAPRPADEDIAAAREQLQNDLGETLTDAKSSSERIGLANQLMNDAPKSSEVAERFAMFLEARDLAAKAGDAILVIQCVDRLTQWFEIDDAVLLKADAIVETAKANAGVDAAKEVARTALDLAEEMDGDENPELIESLTQAALLASRRSRDRDFQAIVRERVDEIRGESAG